MSAWLTYAREQFPALSEIIGRGSATSPSAKWRREILSRQPEEVARLTEAALGTIDRHVSKEEEKSLKGLVWAAALLGDFAAARDLGRLCDRMGPGRKPICSAVTLAAAKALSECHCQEGHRALYQLFRTTRTPRVESSLAKLIAGIDADWEWIAPTSLEDFGLEAHGAHVSSSGHLIKAEKGKDTHQISLIKKALSFEKDRLEAALRTGSPFDVVLWQTLLRDHPLTGPMVRSLIWVQDSQTFWGSESADPTGGALTLWHPLTSTAEDIDDWRERTFQNEVKPPFRQAFRETYVLTDAERTTYVYSNRFAGLIVRQHQLLTLARLQGWETQPVTNWGNPGALRKQVGDHFAEFDLDYLAQEGDDQPGLLALVTTGSLRFMQEGVDAPLELVPPVDFSETLRDADLFVSVASVGTDPYWVDRWSPEWMVLAWERQAFGELGATAQSRREVLSRLIPRLADSNRFTLEGNFLRVQGNLHSYAIHVGSAAVRHLPSAKHICIVPQVRKEAPLVLPFEDDALLSLILSKAFLLVADDCITDPVILEQLP